MDEINFPLTFGEWLKRRRKVLDLTQAELASRAGCSVPALRKIEAGERRPSKQLAGLLAESLGIPSEGQTTFIRVARGELNIERLPSPAHSPAGVYRSVLQPSTSPGNLPGMLTPFIGRELELASLSQLLRDPHCRLLTLIGPGGIGKTRLAIEVASRQTDIFPDGIWFVPLAPLSSSEYLIPAISGALNIRFQDATRPLIQLKNYLHNKKSLLVLDNTEHLLDGVGLFTEILESASQVKLLVTSRERLNLSSEWTFEIQGLAVPSSDQVEQFEAYSSVILFLQTARRIRAGFELRDDERQWMAHICRIMEGMPLGIELAASWVGLLSCEEIAREIEHNLDFLTVSLRDIPERHRSMRAVFDQSWKMLSVDEQQVLSRLSIFKGGFQRQAAEQIAGASLSILSTLMNRTLLRRTAAGRYDLHELVRQYSASYLAADPQAHTAVQKRHYDFFLIMAEAADQGLKGRHQLEWLERLEQDYNNLRIALEFALNPSGLALPDDELALRLSGALRWFWRMRGHFHEGRDWLTESLRQLPKKPTAARAKALMGLSLLLNGLGDLSAVRPLAEQGVEIYRGLNDHQGLAETLTVAGLTLVWQGEATQGINQLKEALVNFREAGDRWGEAYVLYRLGSTLADYSGDLTGRTMLEESTMILEDLGERYLFISVLISLGIIDMGLGDYVAARIRFERSLAAARELRHPWGVADALTNLGCVFRVQGDYGTAQSCFEEAHRVYQEHGRSIWESDVLCALAENHIAQGDLQSARQCIQVASTLLESSQNKWLQALVWFFRGMLAYYEGDAEGAATLIGETSTLAREGQFKPDLARSLVALGRVRLMQGEIALAIESLREGLGLFRDLGHKLGIAIALEQLASVYTLQGDGIQAIMLLSSAHALRQAMGAPIQPVDRDTYNSTLAACRTQIGDDAFATAWARAAARSYQEVVEEIMPSLYKYNSITR